jgi:multiple sugar transport system permease protein
VRSLALVEKHREDSLFVDPANPDAGTIQWAGRWRTLEQSWQFELNWGNFASAWETIDFPRLFFNTIVIAGLSTLGAVVSAICVAYGFSRFRFPGRNGLFLLMLATIILPFQVTLIPSYAVYLALGWVGTWLPLIVPHFFANAYNVFLLRQYFLTIPRDLDEAAMIDGAGPLRILRSVIVPQAIPAIVAVTLFHFFWAWNEYFLPLVYLQGNPELQPLSVGLGRFNSLYSQEPTLIQAAAILAMALPVVVFFFAQRAFMRGVVFAGVEK